ncbi:MAG TPA: alpha/beta hydrolase [Chryseolinea sp.]
MFKKGISAIIVIVLTTGISLSSLAQQDPPKVNKGVLNGVDYVILIPDGWKGKLVMYAHGYEFMGSPRQSNNPRFVDNMKPFLERGFAVAASDYSMQGYAIPQGVDDTEALRNHFVKTYGKPDTTYFAGHSMGGAITLATLENISKNYQGGLPLCPLSSRPYLQVRKEFDLYATFNVLFPGIVSPVSEIFDLSKPKTATPFSEMMPRMAAIREAIIAKDSALGVAFAKRFDLKFDDLPASLFFNDNVLKDIAQKANGNPFDNTNTVYSGFPDDWLINEKVERLKATVNPDKIFGKYDRTGKIDKPVVLMHTLYDQLIPPEYGVVNFENMVHQQNRDQYLVVKYTNGQGHCVFSPQQIGEAFDDLRRWVKTGKRVTSGAIE